MKTFTLLLVILINHHVYAQQNFSGNWKLNTAKSKFNNAPSTAAAAKLFVDHKKTGITLQRNDFAKETLKTDGTEIEIPSGNSIATKIKVSVKLTPDKLGLIETRNYFYPEGTKGTLETKKVRKWTMSADKKILTIQEHLETNNPSVSYDMQLIYERQ